MREDISTINVGKRGITDSLIAEMKDRLGKNERIRVKMLRSARDKSDRKGTAIEVAKKAGAELLDVRGNTFLLGRKK